MTYSPNSIPSIFHPHLIQFSPHTHSLTHLTSELELEWVIALAESTPSITLVSNELILGARVMLHHLHQLQNPFKDADSGEVELGANYVCGEAANLYQYAGLCANLANLAYLLTGTKEKEEENDDGQDELEQLLCTLFANPSTPFNRSIRINEVGAHTAKMLKLPQSTKTYGGEYRRYQTLYKNTLRIAFLEFLAIQPLTMSDSHYAQQLATFTLPTSE